MDIKRKYNYKGDVPDNRDLGYTPSETAVSTSPALVDLRQCPCAFPPIYDQGELNSCTANAVAAVLYYDMIKQQIPDTFEPSRLFIYYNERSLEGSVDDPDYGVHGAPAAMRDCIKTVNRRGYCPESLWPYNEDKFDVKPPDEAFQMAKHHHSYKYERIQQDITHLKACLADGYPFVFGFIIFQGFEEPEVKETGVIPLPGEGEYKMGGHAVSAVGYDDNKKHFIIRNSFGTDWGDKGYGYMPYDFITNADYAVDFWVIRKVIED